MKYILTESQLQKLIRETSEEEAWELVGQDHDVIKSLVSEKGYENNEISVAKLIPIIDKLPIEEFEYEELKKFHNLENKKGDRGLLKKMKEISKTENPREHYKEYMEARDKGERRNRGYDPVKNFDRIVSGSYESPVVLKIHNKYYLVGGRTRIYASVAAGIPIKIKILSPSDL